MIGQGNPGEPGSLASPVVNNNGSLVFNRVEDLSYTGSINGTGTVEKQAAGKLTLNGTHTYSGATLVNAGTLLVNGTIAASAVTVTNGTLGGNGTIKRPVVIQANGRLAPGTSIGALTISNSLSLAGATLMEVNAVTGTNDVVRGLSTVTYGGALTISNLQGSFVGTNRFKLFSAQTYRGLFASLTPASPGTNLLWNTNSLAIDGTLRIVSAEPVTMSQSISANLLKISWPDDHIGWRLQAQTNSNSIGTNWVDFTDTTTTNDVTIVIDPEWSGAFFRLTYP
jgi:autotransporter-associated beta strand protein